MQPSKENHEDTPTKGQWQWQSEPDSLFEFKEPKWTSYSPIQNFLLEKAYFDQQKVVDLGDSIVFLQYMTQKKNGQRVSVRRIIQPETEDIEKSERDFEAKMSKPIDKEVESLEDTSNLFSGKNFPHSKITSQESESENINKGPNRFSGTNFAIQPNETKTTSRGQVIFGPFSGNSYASQANGMNTTNREHGLFGNNPASQANSRGYGLFGNHPASQINEMSTINRGHSIFGNNPASQINETQNPSKGQSIFGDNLVNQPNEPKTISREQGHFGPLSGSNLAGQANEAKTASKGQDPFSGNNFASQQNETKNLRKGQSMFGNNPASQINNMGPGFFGVLPRNSFASQQNEIKNISKGQSIFGNNFASQAKEPKTISKEHGPFGSLSGSNLLNQPNETKNISKEQNIFGKDFAKQPNEPQATGKGQGSLSGNNLVNQQTKNLSKGQSIFGNNLVNQRNDTQATSKGEGLFSEKKVTSQQKETKNFGKGQNMFGNNPASQRNEPKTTSRIQGFFGNNPASQANSRGPVLFGVSPINNFTSQSNEMSIISRGHYLFPGTNPPPDWKFSSKVDGIKDMNMGIWQWKSNAEWTFYSFDHNELIEEAYQNDKVIEIQDYIISPISLTQTEKANPKAVRPIRRISWKENQETDILLEGELPKRIENGFGTLNNFLAFIKGREIGNFIEVFEGIEASDDIAKLNQEIVPRIRICFQNEVDISSSQKPSESNITSLINSLKAQEVLSYEEKILIIQNILKFKMEKQCRRLTAVFRQDLNTFHDFYACILKAYTMTTFLYLNLNKYLREEAWDRLHALLPYLFCFCKAFYSLKKEVQEEKDSKAQAPQEQSFLTLLRGTCLDDFALSFYNPKEMKIFYWSSITSTTSNPQVAKDFMDIAFNGKDKAHRVLFKILIPVTEEEFEYLRYLDIKPYSARPNEDEVILPPSSVFELKEFLKEGVQVTITLELKIDSLSIKRL